MKQPLLFLFLLISTFALHSQPNCEAFKSQGNTLAYEACKKNESAKKHYQFSKAFQKIIDEAIAIDPSFDYAYKEKSVAYLKSGDFFTWKQLMDKAVEINPIENLGYRGWCRYQFFRDYQGAIADIELLDSLIDYEIGFSANGDYHLNIAKALCYKALGQKDKAIHILTTQLSEKDYYPGIYDQLHLGVLYLETGNYTLAVETLNAQMEFNPLGEVAYYLGLAYKAQGKNTAYQQAINQAKALYTQDKKMFDPYTHPYDKVYLSEIEAEWEEAQK